jgi:type I restriction enzyme S subunit
LFLSTWDRTLERLSRQISGKQHACGYLQEALVRGGLHLKRDAKPWPVVSLGDVTEPLTARNGARFDRDSVMGVTKADGLVPMKEHVIAEDIARYLIVPPGGFAYNPMRINIGSIAMSEFKEDVLVSPDYVVFACDRKRLLPRFLNHLRRTKAWSDFMTIAGNGSVRVRIYYASLADFEFHLPPPDEQRGIVEVLDDAEREIRSLMAEQAALEKQRDALATELLTGRLRVGDVAEATFAR